MSKNKEQAVGQVMFKPEITHMNVRLGTSGEYTELNKYFTR